MKSQSRMFARLCLSVFLLGVFAFAGFSYRRVRVNKSWPSRPLRMIQLEYSVDAQGQEIYRALRVHDVDINGYWHTIRYGVGSASKIEYKKDDSNAILGNANGAGWTQLDSGPSSANYQGGMWEMSKKMHTQAYYDSNPNIVGTEHIAGFKVYRNRNVSKDDPGTWVEQDNCPEVGMAPLRTIVHSADGHETIVEAVKVEFQ